MIPVDPRFRSRRSFLGRCTGAAFGLPIFSTLTDLRLINSVLAQSGGGFTDYKALVCIFLGGGNDANNILAPSSGQAYTDYATARSNLALQQNAGAAAYLLPLTVSNNGYGWNFGTHSSCPELAQLFDAGKMAFLCNVGTLVEPITKAQYQANTKARPPQLFSHNDQVTQWMTSIADRVSRTGWGGRMADLLYTNNTSTISMSISLAGTNTWEVGDVVHTYQVSAVSTGSVATSIRNSTSDSAGRVAARMQAIRDVLAHGRANLFEKDYAALMQRALNGADILNNAVTQADSGNGGATLPLASFPIFPASSLGNQMKTIARIINARNILGFKRQIFFCQVGGYDTHSGQLTSHPGLLSALSQAAKAFYDTTVAMGMADKITAFTASDFGRTFQSNGAGSDHGWGTHQMVVGGAVRGQKLYGTYPTLAINGPDDTGLGRWIPTTSVDQYSATLAKWFGVSDADLDVVFPNLGHFGTRDLGFLSPT